MARKVLVIGEVRDGELRNVSFEAVAAGKEVANGGEVVGVLLGENISDLANQLIHYGADRVVAVNHPDLAQYTTDAYQQAILQVLDVESPEALILGHTSIGKDVAPRVAMKLGAGLISDVISVEKDGDEIVFTRPIYSGKAFEKKKVNEGIIFATIRPNNIAPLEQDASKSGDVSSLTVDIKDLRTTIREVVRKATGGVDLSEAKVIVAGGRGVKSKEGFEPLQKLADVLGAAVGASRGACDADYCDYSLQIGQTGKVVTPDLYFAIGISGAIQHLAGMSNSKVIVAINKDPEAPIFEVADYGIVGDLFEVVPLLTEELKNVLVSS
ncbi:electron transfer flavoprotein subunit alpha/FixB family protein [Halalkalibacterium halodurans]|uniref:Electron transfer flavoprotein (Alpha subunit) n=1 Tax=Halalkalibacterium halodurans (strain ATCC BAA-125 / DSM 18197 / FERM 7344 / JCM 9153 / C-125) TaxID=272558 RepID=Q9K8A7_HALH5|nr:electron transfer flavoprotein subunit alpha/FixB family protein [Halalkalibacterium halodurans]MED4082082.1 electron transfer flavoprotein subunit alpha/FixB family protein [Halalkalibacterium halodurans]MED4084340.1 electron transfer flavoprotein subunit alpha/FixB family protein [Halalkalibacterium halodurans]MED4103649.1 electron transfer flavoprotein subunit alpha/FixB family protein [Halalkalibacterium halodurans]MED4107616.1 electron transfer flavoprotein subunit alpha/FixB family pro